jgi:hypothetical protein
VDALADDDAAAAGEVDALADDDAAAGDGVLLQEFPLPLPLPLLQFALPLLRARACGALAMDVLAAVPAAAGRPLRSAVTVTVPG